MDGIAILLSSSRIFAEILQHFWLQPAAEAQLMMNVFRFCVVAIVVAASEPVPHRLRIDRLSSEHAMGISITSPVLSWDMTSADCPKNSTASAVTIFIQQQNFDATSRNGMSAVQNVTLQRESSLIDPVRYVGRQLLPSTRYFWIVCVLWKRLKAPQRSETCSETASFVTGRTTTPWKATWIGGNSERYPNPCVKCMAPYHSWCPKDPGALRCGVQGIQLRSPIQDLPKSDIVAAVVHATGLGFYELRVNGGKVGDAVLDPGFSTNFTERLLYSTFDVTSQVANQTALVLSARLGGGKFSLGLGAPILALLVELTLRFANGDIITMVLLMYASFCFFASNTTALLLPTGQQQ